MKSGGEWIARAPGRINLIGEHIDYNGLPVLPMTLNREVRINFTLLPDPIVRLKGATESFPEFEFRLDEPITAQRQGDWSNYVRAAAWGLLGHGLTLPRGIAGTVCGNVPMASGLASSSALVVASALALLAANEIEMPALELAELLAKAERFVGVEGGGMDQAASLLGEDGHALWVEFAPLRITKVPLPGDWAWVVASSLKQATKAKRARKAYNERRQQCLEAISVLMADRQVRRACAGMPFSDIGDSWVPGQLSGGLDSVRLPYKRRSALTRLAVRKEVERIRNANPGQIDKVGDDFSYRELTLALSSDELLELARRALAPTLFRRFRHVVSEGERVQRAVDAIHQSDIREMGTLMRQSHESLRRDYEVSTPALDDIVEIAIEAGAAGARLTGAGFGGCAVALCKGAEVPNVVGALRERFYAGRVAKLPNADILFFADRPAAGANVVRG